MRLLVDTCALLWYAAGSRQLSVAAREAIADPGNEAWLSVVSVWEIATKHALGRLRDARLLTIAALDTQSLFATLRDGASRLFTPYL